MGRRQTLVTKTRVFQRLATWSVWKSSSNVSDLGLFKFSIGKKLEGGLILLVSWQHFEVGWEGGRREGGRCFDLESKKEMMNKYKDSVQLHVTSLNLVVLDFRYSRLQLI